MKTGFAKLDELIELNKGKVIFLAGGPGIGKSNFALNIVDNISLKEERNTIIFNLELSKQQIIRRLNLIETDIEIPHDEKELNKLIEEKIHIIDTPAVSIDNIVEQVKNVKKNVEFIVIDYLQLMDIKNGIEEVAIKLKKLAQELNVAILVVSQAPRKVEERENKKPVISDFTNMQPIIDVSDVVMFICKEDLEKEIIIAKNTLGKMETLKLAFESKYCRFED